MFKEITNLRKSLPSDQKLSVIYSDKKWIVSFGWSPPVSNNEVANIQKQLGIPLPEDYIYFLTKVSNGCTLYYDIQYGQWGYWIYGINELIEKQAIWEKSLPTRWQKNFIAFAELYGEADVLIFDLHQSANKIKTESPILEGNAYYPVDKWLTVSSSFHQWIQDLIIAQGLKYWEN